MATATAQPNRTLDEVEAQWREANHKLETLKVDLRSQQETLNAATGQFNAACRDLAAGKDADPGTYRDSIARIEQRIMGLESLIIDQTKVTEGFVPELTELRQRKQRQAEQAEIARLLAVQSDRAAECELCRRDYAVALEAEKAADFALSSYRLKLGKEQTARERGQR